MRNRRQNTCKTEKNTVIFEIPGKQKPAKAKKIIEKRYKNVLVEKLRKARKRWKSERNIENVGWLVGRAGGQKLGVPRTSELRVCWGWFQLRWHCDMYWSHGSIAFPSFELPWARRILPTRHGYSWRRISRMSCCLWRWWGWRSGAWASRSCRISPT